ncbi:hypothetical protein AYL99_10418 [Fonsecaea erecta]|uniref:Cytosolic endo-beta-N-acetylglucosaminidase TIM barrel domain-containing protein n=1 Tax=Fonsecaea erecta TaxID=1367422 RepID=A0A178Z8T8_9EURO|nr:hypothetical protein AYL99_10418 [Fonsecaea erecta]OAP55445.1 hypothetical protein AYL99_10418 [Fonsecaea erecta]
MAPTEEEKKDDQDRFVNGFAFFRKLDDIYAWEPKDADVLQIANTPLYKRPTGGDQSKCKILVMHDYRGNYLPYEASQGLTQPRKDYIMEYWQHVEIFNYFSHRRVTIPPPAWINAGHRNGALVLGTFIIEPFSQEDPKRIFHTYSPTPAKMPYRLPDILAEMASVYGFDGWLLNFESMIVDGADFQEDANGKQLTRHDKWSDFSQDVLKTWVAQLKTRLAQKVPHGKVIWYDALTKKNKDYGSMNVLNTFNDPYRDAAGSILINYFYANHELDATIKMAGAKLDTVYHGVDCWAQTNDDMKNTYDPDSGRRTAGFREDGQLELRRGTGHGGTATGRFVGFIAEKLDAARKAVNDASTKPGGAGVGLFAHGWAYEHFMPGTSVDRFMWEGEPNLTPLTDPTDKRRMPASVWKQKQDLRRTQDIGWQAEFDCPCSHSIVQHLWRHPPTAMDFKDWGIVKSALEYPAGTKSFFHTDYTEPVIDQSGQQYRYRLGQQSVLPIPGRRKRALNFTNAGESSGELEAVMSTKCTLRINLQNKGINDQSKVSGSLVLHQLNIDAALKPEITLVYRRLMDTTGLPIQLCARNGAHDEHYTLSGKASLAGQNETLTQSIPLRNTQDFVQDIRITMDNAPANTLASLTKDGVADLIEIISLTIKPQDHNYPDNKITKATLEKKTGKTGSYTRLMWTLANDLNPPKPLPNTTPTTTPRILPLSPTTMQFSHFHVRANGRFLGVAYTLGFPISEEEIKSWPAGKVHFQIRGIAFDGSYKDSGGWEGDLVLPA